jgi:hypothetical protein
VPKCAHPSSLSLVLTRTDASGRRARRSYGMADVAGPSCVSRSCHTSYPAAETLDWADVIHAPPEDAKSLARARARGLRRPGTESGFSAGAQELVGCTTLEIAQSVPEMITRIELSEGRVSASHSAACRSVDSCLQNDRECNVGGRPSAATPQPVMVALIEGETRPRRNTSTQRLCDNTSMTKRTEPGLHHTIVGVYALTESAGERDRRSPVWRCCARPCPSFSRRCCVSIVLQAAGKQVVGKDQPGVNIVLVPPRQPLQCASRGRKAAEGGGRRQRLQSPDSEHAFASAGLNKTDIDATAKGAEVECKGRVSLGFRSHE